MMTPYKRSIFLVENEEVDEADEADEGSDESLDRIVGVLQEITSHERKGEILKLLDEDDLSHIADLLESAMQKYETGGNAQDEEDDFLVVRAEDE